MNTTRLLEIAEMLKGYYKDQAELQIRLSHSEADMVDRQIAMIPAEGWPGSNDDKRKDARTKAIRADEICEKIEAQIFDFKSKLAKVKADIDGLEAERRALEWDIKARMVEAIQQPTLLRYAGMDWGKPVDETVFEDATQAQMEAGLFDQVDLTPAGEQYLDDIPF